MVFGQVPVRMCVLMGDATEDVAITVQVPVHRVGSLKELLREFPRLQFVSSGWIVRRVVIYGPPAVMALFAPRLKQWKLDGESQDAW